jgi:hypothetical protein
LLFPFGEIGLSSCSLSFFLFSPLVVYVSCLLTYLISPFFLAKSGEGGFEILFDVLTHFTLVFFGAPFQPLFFIGLTQLETLDKGEEKFLPKDRFIKKIKIK